VCLALAGQGAGGVGGLFGAKAALNFGIELHGRDCIKYTVQLQIFASWPAVRLRRE
jgi:hypothetical protein